MCVQEPCVYLLSAAFVVIRNTNEYCEVFCEIFLNSALPTRGVGQQVEEKEKVLPLLLLDVELVLEADLLDALQQSNEKPAS